MSSNCLVVGLDGSVNARRAGEWAAELARALGSRVVAVHALGLLEQAERGEAARCLDDEWSAPLHEAGVDYECVVRDGNPVVVLLEAAIDVGADLIVVGSRGVGGHPELLLGSTSTQVAQRSPIPVVIVPDGQTRP